MLLEPLISSLKGVTKNLAESLLSNDDLKQ